MGKSPRINTEWQFIVNGVASDRLCPEVIAARYFLKGLRFQFGAMPDRLASPDCKRQLQKCLGCFVCQRRRVLTVQRETFA